MSVDPDLPATDLPALRPGAVGSPHLRAAAAVAVGGAAGALARAGVAEIVGHSPRGWPWSTLLTNATGSALLGVLLVILARSSRESGYPRALLGTGLLGGYTTFSTLTVDAVQLARFERPGVAALYVVASAAGMLLSCLTGVAATRRLVRPGPGHEAGGSG